MLRIVILAACSATSAIALQEEIQEEAVGVDGLRAYEHVRNLVGYGPHPAGSAAQRRVASYIRRELTRFGLNVSRHEFTAQTPVGFVQMENIWAALPGEQESVLILAGHYDSKLFSEFEFVGANDSGSSTGILLELARVLAESNPVPYSLWFVFFDGEEAFREWSDSDSLYGSRAFVQFLKERAQLERVEALVLLDMVGSKTLKLRKDFNSTRWLSDAIWETARRMGYGHIFDRTGSTGAVDDHIPFAELGIPVVDIIDLDNYPYWHLAGDTLDKLSVQNMEAVGNVVLKSLPELVERIETRKAEIAAAEEKKKEPEPRP